MDIWKEIEEEEAAFDELNNMNSDAENEEYEEDVRKPRAIGKCPKCGENVLYGKYGAYCQDRCGMWLNRAMGSILTEEEVVKVLKGEKILKRNLKSKNGNKYDAYLKPLEVVEYSYTDEDGEEVSGYQYKYEMSFPKKRRRDK